MKKHLILLLAALMIFAMAVPVYAGTADEADLGKVAFGIKGTNTPWKADGVISDGEYYEVPMKDSWYSYAWNDVDDTAETQARSLGQKLYMSWDDTYVYAATVYKVTEFYNEYGGDPGSMWLACAIQNNFAPKTDDVSEMTNRLEYGLGLTSDTGEQISFVWADTSDGATGWAPTASDFIVKNNNKTLTYESRTPWTAFLAGKPAVGDVFGYCIVWAAGKGDGHVHAQLASGCTGNSGKNANNFAQVTLEKAPAVETEPPATETSAPAAEKPAETTAPKTADVFSLAAFAALVTICGAVVLTKKRGK